jgi:hypothetical protein
MMVVIALARLRICATYRGSLRTTIWSDCSPSGATALRRRALQAPHQCHDGLAVQESKDRCDVVSLHTVASDKSSFE